MLRFRHGQKDDDPRAGLTLFGPLHADQHCGPITVGIAGPKQQRTDMKEYLQGIHSPVAIETHDIARPFFPGLEAAFGISINFAAMPEIDVSLAEIERYLRFSDRHQRVYNLVNLFANPLLKFHDEEERQPALWIIAIPEDIYRHGRPESLPRRDGTPEQTGLAVKDRNSNEPFLFAELRERQRAYDFEVNFHNQLKARLLGSRIITQIVRDSKVAYRRIWVNEKQVQAEEKMDSAKAWNLATAIYYKSGGLPWRLEEARPDVCYVGLVYKKLSLNSEDRNACCAAQMFLQSGDGMVFRGNLGPWCNPETQEFHMTESDAADLAARSMVAFEEKCGRLPSEIFIHSKTHFNDEEWRGFAAGIPETCRAVGIRIRENRELKLYREKRYAVPRGSVFRISRRRAFLWAGGFVPASSTQLGVETPNPLEIELLRGDADLKQVCKDILSLTKLNYNGCSIGNGLPVTLQFADAIGEILTAGVDIDNAPLPFRHYI